MTNSHKTLIVCAMVFSIGGALIHASTENNTSNVYNTNKKSSAITKNQNANVLNTVNNDIRIQADTAVVKSASGKVTVAQGVHVGAIETVNGDIDIAANAVVDKIHSVNGDINIAAGARVQIFNSVNADLNAENAHFHELNTVNGDISLKDSTVTGDITAVSGDITLAGHTTVDGIIVYKKPESRKKSDHATTLTIGPDVVVKGGIILYHPITLDIHPKAKFAITPKAKESEIIIDY